MEGENSSSSSSSSCASFDSFDDVIVTPTTRTVKFLSSYGGKILPRYPDGKLRYAGGDTRVLAVDRSIPFSELDTKMRELCGWDSVSLRCQLPNEDLDDALVSITSDEDLANLYEEYDLAGRDRLHPLKIRVFLFPKLSKSEGTSSSSSNSPPAAATRGRSAVRLPIPVANRCVHQNSSITRQARDPTSQGQYFVVHHRNH